MQSKADIVTPAPTDTTPSKAIVVDGVEMVYHPCAEPFHALKGIDLEVLSGDIELLMGPSGSGKTTLLSILGVF